MKFHQLRFLTDENISPKVVTFLRNHGLDVLDTKEQGWQGKSDDELLKIAYQDKRWVLTHDTDFGVLAIHEGKPYLGIIFLRVRNFQSHNVIRVCNQLLNHDVDFSPQALVVVEEARIRIRQVDRD
jgi:predicted nuclease of predicted toxin-antitoxin system